MVRTSFSFITLLLVLASCRSSIPEEIAVEFKNLPEHIDYNVHVKPILSDRCFKCHGPDANQRKADFRIDLAENAYAKTLSETSVAARSISKGKASQSEVFLRMISDDADYMMPPPSSNLSLSNREIAILSQWIEEGATYKEHWSFIPPKKTDLPKVSDVSWPSMDLDYFILNSQDRQDLSPASEADKLTQLRRISLDIIGLPPSVEEIDAFIKEYDDTKYEEKIDELLNRPEYGERMASIWLDAARYADSHGYQDDGLRNSWPWRKWVIDAFNTNMPYDQFITEQLAGDLLPNSTKSQKLATSFNRNHPQTQEGGVVEEEYRVEYVADRTNTYGKAILGLTMECARCHDHKYDPISQRDYYALSAFFNNNNDSGIVPYNGEATPTVMLPTPEEEYKLDSLKKEIESLKGKLVSEQFLDDFNEWLKNQELKLNEVDRPVAEFDFEKEINIDRGKLDLDGDRSPGWGGIGRQGEIISYHDKATGTIDAAIFGDPDSKPSIVQGYKGNGVLFNGDCGIRFNRRLDYDRDQPFSVSIWINIEKQGEKGPIFNNTNGDFEGYRGWICKLNEDGTLSFQLNHVWPNNSIDIQTLDSLSIGNWHHIAMTYDGSSKADGLEVYINGKIPRTFLHKDNLHKSLLHGVDGSNWSNYPLMMGKEKDRSIQNVVMDEFKVYDRTLSRIEVMVLAGEKMETVKDRELLLEYYLKAGFNAEYVKTSAELQAVRKEENLLSTNVLEVMVMDEKSQVRPTFILDRGMYDSPLEEVAPNTLSKFGKFVLPEDANRLDLAKWTTSKENPLTARVHVNRIWNMIFGKGLVDTQDDFGNQGALPSHPELLDYLAIDFMENGWDTKRLIKKILMSSTYRQSSIIEVEKRVKDPQNKYYSRFPAHRLSAEVIRDQALASSELLVDSIGGPSVYPYQPKGIWEALATRNATVYQQGKGDDLYRRSLYTIWKRSAPPPSMLNFDAPDRYLCTVDRQNTSTPLQSLVLMNDPQYLEASKALADHVLSKGGNLEDHIAYLSKALISRLPIPEEAEILKSLFQDNLKRFEQEPQEAKQFLNVGEYKVDDQDRAKEIASLTIVASTLMNYDEFVMKR